MKRSYSYRVGLLHGHAHAAYAAEVMESPPTAQDVATIGVPAELDAAEYREGYMDGVARQAAGKRSPNVKVLP